MTEKKISCSDLRPLLFLSACLTFLPDPWDVCLLCCALYSESVQTNLSCECCRWKRRLMKECVLARLCVLRGDRCSLISGCIQRCVFPHTLFDFATCVPPFPVYKPCIWKSVYCAQISIYSGILTSDPVYCEMCWSGEALLKNCIFLQPAFLFFQSWSGPNRNDVWNRTLRHSPPPWGHLILAWWHVG